MAEHLLPILALVTLCAGWVLFQRWLKRMDPEGRDMEADCGGGCGARCRKKRDPMETAPTSCRREAGSG